MGTPTVAEQFPHCDQRILHRSGECEHCDSHPDWQALRTAWGIAFTGHVPLALLPECGAKGSYRPGGSTWRCRQARGHDAGDRPTLHSPAPENEILPCPADAARPPGSGADHRRWGGNKPTGAEGDPAWPAESTASVMMYGDKGGRASWPLRERVRRRVMQPLKNRKMRRAGWHRDGNGWWRGP